MLADSHCHLLDARLIDRADEIVANLERDGLEFIVQVGDSVSDSATGLEFALRHERVYCTIGVHPHMLGDYTNEFEIWAVAVRNNEKIVAVGEVGLDYYHITHPKEFQAEIFTRQIRLAHELKLPLVIHTRDAWTDTMAILCDNREYLQHGILFHCFSHGETELREATEKLETPTNAVYFAFGGWTRDNGAIAACPIDRMLLETDSPYLNPPESGGKKILNEPKNVRHVCEYIASVRQIPLDEIARATLENTKNFYKIGEGAK